jgi:uncharacterized protein
MGKVTLRGMYGAVDRGDADEVRRILAEHPEELMGMPPAGSSWLHYAAHLGHIHVMDVFFKAGLDVNWARMDAGRMDPGDTPLVGALDYGQYETAKYLLSRGANPNLGRCLIAALNSETNSFEMVALLVENGVDVNQVWRFGDEERGPLFNALSWAADRAEIAAYLRAHGALLPNGLPQPSYSSRREEIIAFFGKQFGPVDPRALQEIVPTSDHPISIHRIGPAGDRESLILFTTGMSDRPMNVPPGAEEFQFAELLIELPKDWALDRRALADPNQSWPIDWLRRIAAYVREERTWLGGPVTIIANSDPPSPIALSCRFTSMLLAVGYDQVGPIALQDGRQVQVYSLLPLYENERGLEIAEGLPELFRRLDQFEIKRRVEVGRPSVAAHSV